MTKNIIKHSEIIALIYTLYLHTYSYWDEKIDGIGRNSKLYNFDQICGRYWYLYRPKWHLIHLKYNKTQQNDSFNLETSLDIRKPWLLTEFHNFDPFMDVIDPQMWQELTNIDWRRIKTQQITVLT